MQLNFELFDAFKEAAKKCDLEVKPGSGHHTIKLDNGRYIYCWTPINKMFSLYEYYENKEWDRALDYLKNNFDDFHLEFGGDSIEKMIQVCEAFCDIDNSKLTTQDIIDIIHIMQDDVKVEQKVIWNRLKYDLS